jgi:hypothetical protein
MDLNERKGLVPNLTSRMSESKRNQWKEKYIKLKKSTIVLTIGTITYVDAKQLAIDLLTSKVKRFGYGADLVLFGEVVPIINSSHDLCIYRNESSVI